MKFRAEIPKHPFRSKKNTADFAMKIKLYALLGYFLGDDVQRGRVSSCANKGTDQAAKEKQTSKILLPLLSTWKKGTNHKWGGRGVNIGSNISFHPFII